MTRVIGYLIVDDEEGEPRKVLMGVSLEEARDYIAQNCSEVSTNWCDEEGVFWGHNLNPTHTRISYRPYAALREILEDGTIVGYHSVGYSDFIVPYLIGDRRHTSTSYSN